MMVLSSQGLRNDVIWWLCSVEWKEWKEYMRRMEEGQG